MYNFIDYVKYHKEYSYFLDKTGNENCLYVEMII